MRKYALALVLLVACGGADPDPGVSVEPGLSAECLALADAVADAAEELAASLEEAQPDLAAVQAAQDAFDDAERALADAGCPEL